MERTADISMLRRSRSIYSYLMMALRQVWAYDLNKALLWDGKGKRHSRNDGLILFSWV
ncbi:hypothetical protein [Roseivirga sp.]|uniref:hypothetical protein n=1 Tax=Roseivirga sp. TaxID=1964215 RepID=UPI003B524A92